MWLNIIIYHYGLFVWSRSVSHGRIFICYSLYKHKEGLNKDIIPRNSKGEPHGYVEKYIINKLWYKCFYENGLEVGYEEYYIYIFKGGKSFMDDRRKHRLEKRFYLR